MIRVLLAALLICPTAASAQPALVILVRHAERDTAPPRDPVLTPAGIARARALHRAVASAAVGSVITTQLQRTQLTAKPLMDSLGLTPIVVPASAPVSAHAEAVAAAVRARPKGEAVLVVGHSNTIPAIIAALGGPTMPDLCDDQYASLFVLQFGDSPSPRFVLASYGAADPAELTGCPRTMGR
jgi:broad specificity phosphatase PhoE